jgi:hypothetical protein
MGASAAPANTTCAGWGCLINNTLDEMCNSGPLQQPGYAFYTLNTSAYNSSTCPWQYGSQSKICGSCASGQSWNGSNCIASIPNCSGGQSWNGSSCVCMSGQTWNGSLCVSPPPICSGGQSWNGFACACPSGQNWDGSVCFTPIPTCSGGQNWNGVNCSCPSGQNWSGSMCVNPTPTCSGGQSWNGSACVCATGFVWNSRLAICQPQSLVTCDAPRSVVNGVCTCPTGQTWTGTTCQSSTVACSTRFGARTFIYGSVCAAVSSTGVCPGFDDRMFVDPSIGNIINGDTSACQCIGNYLQFSSTEKNEWLTATVSCQ